MFEFGWLAKGESWKLLLALNWKGRKTVGLYVLNLLKPVEKSEDSSAEQVTGKWRRAWFDCSEVHLQILLLVFGS